MLSELMLCLPSTTVLLALVVVAASVFHLWRARCSRANLPPFPATPLPVVGNLLSLSANPRRILEKWRQQCGDVYSMYMGSTLVIVVNRFDAIKDALLTHGEYFSDRPPLFVYQAIDAVNHGLVGSSGDVWKEQRSVSLGILKQLGMGKNVLAEKVQEEVDHFLKLLEDRQYAPFDLGSVTFVALANIICSIAVGERNRYDDPKFRTLIENLTWVGKNITVTNPLNFFPSLMHVPGNLFKSKEIQRRLSETLELFSHHYIKENEEADEGRENFITLYLKQRRLKEENGTPTSLSKKHLAVCIFDLLAAGSDTTALTILWFILHLLHNPSVQEKIQTEIDTQIGSNRKPRFSDKPNLPYLNAAIMETQRVSSIVPLTLPHRCSKTVTFRGYTIPKGATVSPNLDSVLYDPNTWGEDVDVFRPERHLDASMNVISRPEFIPFSIGRRYCLGDTLAKMELFLFTSAMLQKFTFLPENPNNLPPMDDIFGLTRNPHPFNVKIEER